PLRLGMGRFLVLSVLLVLLSGGYLVYDADTRNKLIIRVTDYAQTLGIYKKSTPLSPPGEAASDRQSSPAAALEMARESADPVEIGQSLASFQQEEPRQGADDMPVAMPPEEGSALGEKTLKTGDPVKTESGPPSSYDFSKIIIQFNFNTNYPTNEAFATLNRLAELMDQHPHLRIIITGYTDNTGVLNYNQRLSGFRANIVKGYLVGKGVGSSRIRSRGLGPENPIADNKTSEGRKTNRRVEIEAVE
ncbi:MAG: OmpA family protein, partial [Desulfobulbaceae bacterium]|nr:OmpA family protein [Desulfobulbaceae bacterium]